MATGGLGVAWADGGDGASSHASRGGAGPSARHPAASRPASKPKAPASAAESIAAQPDSRQAITAVRRAVRSVMTPLPDSTPGPVDSPVSWVVLAVTRRQVRPAQVAPQVTAAAAVNNQPPVVDSVNLGTPNASTDTAGASATVGVTVPITPKNAPPAATGSAGTPNPTTGVVTGKVTAADADKDPLTYSGSTTTPKGAVTVTSAGAFTYTPTLTARHDAASATATVIDKTDTFTVTVDDGHGATVAVPVTVTISPKNVAPNGKSSIGPRDVNTGVVTGSVIGADTDGDTMTYAGSTTTAKGSVVVNADGSFTYTPTATARDKAAVFTAPVADKVDTFSVAVNDGHGGTTNVAVTITSTISSSNTVAANGLTTFRGCTLMAADTIFHADVSTLPVMAQSGAWLGVLGAGRGATLRANWGYTWMNATAGMPVNVVSATQRTEKVIFNRGYATSGPSIDSRPTRSRTAQWSKAMPSYPAWDRHLLVFQQGTCVSQELYNVANGVELPANSFLDGLGNAVYLAMYGSSWIAEAGVHYDMSSGLYPAAGWANASHLPYLPLILRRPRSCCERCSSTARSSMTPPPPPARTGRSCWR